MIRYIYTILMALILLVPTNSFAFEPPKPTNYVVDLAGKLSQEQLAALNSKLDGMNKSTKNEFAGLIIPSLNGESIEDVANTTFKSWKIGKAGLDNGVLVVIAIADRKSRIEVGKGVEGDLTDLQSSDILKNTLAPFLKRGDFYGGLNATFDSISSTIESRSKVAVTTTPRSTDNVGTAIFSTALFVSVFGVIMFVIIGMKISSISDRRRRMRNQLEEEADEHIRLMREDLVRQQALRKQAAANLEAQAKAIKEAKARAEEVLKFNETSTALSHKIKPISRNNMPIYNDVHVIPPVIKKPSVHRVDPPEDRARRAKEQRDNALRDLASAERERQRRRNEEEEEERRRRRDREEEDRRRRDREEEDRRRNDSYSSSWSSGSSSSGSDYGSSSGFGGFGGGDSGGGGSSGDW